MTRKIAVWILIVAVLNPAMVMAQVATVPPPPPAAASSSAVIEPTVAAIQLVVGRSTVLDVGVPIARVSLTSADVADALVTSPSQLLIHGKVPGTISMFVWERSGAVRRYELVVGRDVAKLADQVQQLFPNEGIQIIALAPAPQLDAGAKGRHCALDGGGVAAVAPGPRIGHHADTVRVNRHAWVLYQAPQFATPASAAPCRP